MSKKRAFLMGLGLLTALGFSACEKKEEPPMMQPDQPEASLGVGEASAFMHDGALYTFVDPSKDGNQLPSRESQLRHTCGKLSYQTLGNILRSRGIDPTATAVASAGNLYTGGSGALGAPDFVQRVPENDRSNTSGIVRLYDIIIAGVEELILAANPYGTFPAGSACFSVALFNNDDTCNARGLSCFIGMPLTTKQLTQCNDAIVDLKSRPGLTAIAAKRITVATLATAIYLCD